jgi:hypothetical protein
MVGNVRGAQHDGVLLTVAAVAGMGLCAMLAPRGKPKPVYQKKFPKVITSV